jgi:hypothetical protein
MERLVFGHQGIVFVPRQLCLSGRYLSTIDSTGDTLMQDHAVLAKFLMSQPDLILFGGFVKHVIQPSVHTDYADIDVIALNQGVINKLENMFAYRFKEVSGSMSYPRYFIGQSSKAGKTLQVILLNSMPDALQFVHHAQFSGDRVALCNNQFYFDDTIGEAEVRQAITSKIMRRVPSEKSFWLFHKDRLQIEQKHESKLRRKGFHIL